MEYEDVTPEVWSPKKEGDSVEGLLVSKQKDAGVYKSNLYHIQNKDGTFSVWGFTILDDLMLFVEVGDNIKLTYRGLKQNRSGQEMKLVDLQREKKSVKV